MKFFARRPITQQAKSAPAKGGKKPAPPAASKPLLTLDQWLDLLGYGLVLLALVSILAVLTPNKSDFLGGFLNVYSTLFGLGQYIAPLLMGFVGVFLIVRRFGDRFPRLHLGAVVGVLLAFLCLLVTMHAIGTITRNGNELAATGDGGGSVGWGILRTLDESVGNFGAAIVMLIGWLVAFMLMSNVSMAQAVMWVQQKLNGVRGPSDDVITPPWDKPDAGELKINWNRSKKKLDEAKKKNAVPELEPELEIDLPEARPIGANAAAKLAVPVAPNKPLVINTPGQKRNSANPSAPTANKLPPARVIGSGNEIRDSRLEIQGSSQSPISNLQSQPPQISSRFAVERDWILPDVAKVLEPGKDSSIQEADIRKRAKTIEDTLESFGVPGRITEVNRGPTITQFGVEPGFTAMKNGKQVKVKVSRIAALADDLALALAAPRIRIEAPVPGRNIVGIEVPNGETSIVSLRDVMESEEFEGLQRKTKLRLGLGQDVSGHPVIADLTTMPHLLIAGTTGSGKSVCVNAIITALMCYNAPQDLRFIMVDPKRVELTGYNGIPHLISPVVVDVEKVTGVLQWVVREMDLRYRTFAKYGARNIVDFNTKAAEAKSKEPRAEGSSPLTAPSSELKKLPYIVVIIDELADLMMLAPDETEKTLVRLAQMARATGIHLIIATQRPSVDVVTGLIKANFPARIAFTVATSIDSRVIIDSPGAEKLLGRGDMLVITPEAPMPMRAQGCWLSNPEIEKVVRHWRRQLAGGDGALDLSTNAADPITAAMSAPNIPMQGTLDGDLKAAPIAPQNGDPFASPNTWDEARALAKAAGEEDSGDKLFNDAVATVRMNGKASISLLQRRLRIGYTRSARLIEEMESKGIIGPQVSGSQFREVLNNALTPPGGLASSSDDEETMTL